MDIKRNVDVSAKINIPGGQCVSKFDQSVYKQDNYRCKGLYIENPSKFHITHSSQSVQNSQDTKYPKITMGMFFEFMRTAYRINDNFESLANMLTTNSEIDWNKLAKIDLDLQTCNDSDEIFNGESSCYVSKQDGKSTENINKQLKDVHTLCNDKQFSCRQYDFANDIKRNENKTVSQLDVARSINVIEMQEKRETVVNEAISSLYTRDDKMFVEDATDINKRDNVESTEIMGSESKETKQAEENQETKMLHSTSKEETLQETESTLTKIMRMNLSDILHEGLLDSVLPYMIPKQALSQPIIKKAVPNTDVRKCNSLNNISESKTAAITSSAKEKDKNKTVKKLSNTEVEIHVCDEGKNIKKDFRCPQKLLVQKMRYFADVTAEQKLEEIDISVHCDIVIFDWLMRWVKKDIIKKSEWPVLEASNVIPIMVSASFLQMEPLLENCLQYCHDNMSDILKTSAILTCLNDNLLTRLAKLFSNEDVEMLKDKKDKIQSRLFCKLIISLTDANPDSKKGHYSSLATLFKCGKCGKTIIHSIANFVPCVPSAMKIDTKGNISYKHVRDLTWTLNDYICTLRSELRTWRKIYWKLWADCHFLFCQQCDTYFPIHQMDWCCYHPEAPQYFVNEQQRPTPFPLGRYPCCSQRAYRFEVLPNREGCRYREHIPEIKTETDVNILNIFTAHKEIISIEAPQLFFPEKITRLVARDPSIRPGKIMCKETMWWNGMELVPPRPKLGLLGKLWGVSSVRRLVQSHDLQKIHQQRSMTTDTSSPSSSVANSDNDETGTVCEDSSTDDDSNYSEESNAWATLSLTCKTRKRSTNRAVRRNSIRCWSNDVMTRYNQDNQRDFEEKAAMQMMTLLTKRTCADTILSKSYNKQHSQWKNGQPRGGIYVKLEAEFLERHVQSCKSKNSNKSKGYTS